MVDRNANKMNIFAENKLETQKSQAYFAMLNVCFSNYDTILGFVYNFKLGYPKWHLLEVASLIIFLLGCHNSWRWMDWTQ